MTAYARGLDGVRVARSSRPSLPRASSSDGPGQAVQAGDGRGRRLRSTSDHALVTVAARVAIARRVSTRLVTVPVARDDAAAWWSMTCRRSRRRRAVRSGPSRRREPLHRRRSRAIEDVLARFLRAYLAGAADELTYLVPPGTPDRRGGGPLRAVVAGVGRRAGPGRRRAVSGSCWPPSQARDVASGAVYALRYRVRLVRRDRWYVAERQRVRGRALMRGSCVLSDEALARAGARG